MQDRFKFRIYDKEENKMHYDAETTYDYIFGRPTIQERSFGDLLYIDSYIVMQCTGLKDKNNNLIYEGDIINIWCKNLTKNQISDVFYCEERAAFCFHYETDYGNIVPCTMDKTEIEVIGNIYENPELRSK